MKNILLFIIAILLTTSISFSFNQKNEFDKVRKKWFEIIMGLPENPDNQTKKDIEKYIVQIETNAEKALNKIIKEENSEGLFTDLKNMKNGAQVLSSFENVKSMSKAYMMPGSKYYKNEELKQTIIKSLEWLNKNAYHEDLPELGNWWQWEIGIPKSINEIGVIMYGDIPKELITKLTNASKYFQPKATHSGSSVAAQHSTSPKERVSKGGNRMDTAIISFGRGIITNDKKEAMNGVNAIGEIGAIVESNDGFYSDGSFIQHENVAYSGTYASVLFNGLGTMMYISEGTSFLPKDSRLENLYESIVKGYSFLMINGGINDSVSGRSISRDNSSDLDRAKSLIAAFAIISEGVEAPYKEEIRKLVKKSVLENNYSNLVEKINNPVIKKVVKDIVNDKNIKVEELNGTKIFSSMDRAVQVSKREGKFLVSMHSSRIANFETMNGENLKGWYTGDGMTYIYAMNSSAYTDYWPTVDSIHIPGTTESINDRTAGSGERRIPKSVSPNSWAGGSTDGHVAMVGIDFISWNDRTVAKKSWFMLGEEIISIGSGISSSDGQIHTTLDNRIIDNNQIISVNGENIKENVNIFASKGMYVNFSDKKTNENIGYKIIDVPNLSIKLENRKGTWKEIGGKSQEIKEKTYFKLYTNHGENPYDSKYAYVILPMFNEEEVKKYDVDNIKIIRQDNDVHAIYDKKRNITGYNFWTDKEIKINDVKVNSKLSLIKIEKEKSIILAISDPTHLSKKETLIELDGKYQLLSENKDVKLEVTNNTTKIKVNLVNQGKSVVINLKKI